MTLPVGVTTCTLTVGRATSVLGNDATLKVTVVPDFGNKVEQILWSATGDTMESFPEDVPTEDTNITVALPHVDQPGWTYGGAPFTGWRYKITRKATLGTKAINKTVFFSPVQGQTSIDFDTLLDENTGQPSYGVIPSVLSVAGLTGTVGATALLNALGIALVNHGSTASTARPSVTFVVWIGTVKPNNMAAADIWTGASS